MVGWFHAVIMRAERERGHRGNTLISTLIDVESRRRQDDGMRSPSCGSPLLPLCSGSWYWQFCFGLPVDPADLKQKIGVYQSAYAHIMGRAAYEGMAGALRTADHPYSGIMNAARKVVFSRTLRTAEWANTTIVAGDTTEEIDKIRRGGDGHIVVWGGVGFWRSLMRLDLIDEFRLDLHPYVAGEGTRLFDDVPKSYRLDLVSSTEFSNGTIGLHYRRHR